LPSRFISTGSLVSNSSYHSEIQLRLIFEVVRSSLKLYTSSSPKKYNNFLHFRDLPADQLFQKILQQHSSDYATLIGATALIPLFIAMSPKVLTQLIGAVMSIPWWVAMNDIRPITLR